MRFTNAYAGAPVCGPTRCVLLTGLHSGHTSMRANNGFAPIREDEPTLASMLKEQGYVTGGFGKWGIGGRGTSGSARKTRLRYLLRILRPGARAHFLSSLPDSKQCGGTIARQRRTEFL